MPMFSSGLHTTTPTEARLEMHESRKAAQKWLDAAVSRNGANLHDVLWVEELQVRGGDTSTLRGE